MPKFSGAKGRTKVSRSPIKTISQTPDTFTHEGAPAYSRTPKSDLFMLAVSNMVGEETFYESAEDRDARFAGLVRQVAVEDGPWFADFVKWLRSEGNMRSAPVVAAAEAVHARLAAEKIGEVDGPLNRQIVRSVLQRADEPGELLAYWEQKFGEPLESGQAKAKLPRPVKLGIADALEKVYSEFSALKYDTAGKAKRFADVVELTHAKGADDKRHQLYKWLLDRRHNRADGEYPLLTMVAARDKLNAVPKEQRRAMLSKMASGNGEVEGENLLSTAGVTWEWLSSWLDGPLDAKFWEATIPQMGYMALLRNLRNFDEAGISPKTRKAVQARLSDPEAVAKSRQFPFRFWSAYKALSTLHWGPALEEALDYAVKNIPELPGRTLVLIDTSGSMEQEISGKSTVRSVDAAALFGVATAFRGADVDLYGFATGVFSHPLPKGGSVLRAMEAFTRRIGEADHGTMINTSMRATYNGHDRVIVFTDCQTMDHTGDFRDMGGWGLSRRHRPQGSGKDVPDSVPVYAFNLGGYSPAMQPSKPNRYELGGFTDATFRMISLLEAGKTGTWPWVR